MTMQTDNRHIIIPCVDTFLDMWAQSVCRQDQDGPMLAPCINRARVRPTDSQTDTQSDTHKMTCLFSGPCFPSYYNECAVPYSQQHFAFTSSYQKLVVLLSPPAVQTTHWDICPLEPPTHYTLCYCSIPPTHYTHSPTHILARVQLAKPYVTN